MNRLSIALAVLISPILFAEEITVETASESNVTTSTEISESKVKRTRKESEKNANDPTKIITKFGVGYDDGFKFSGSIGLDETRKLNGSIDEKGENWRIGGSWLFPKGILNFNIDGDEHRTSYGVGTFVPLSAFGVDTGEWMLFPMAGASYTDGTTFNKDTNKSEDIKSFGGYAGMFVLRPLDERWTLFGWGGGGIGSDDFNSMWGGGGIGFSVTKRQSLNLVGYASKDSFRTDNGVSVSYTYEFN